ncbi:hypothetical protein C8F01DRAFT_1085345 [Mycena amicta]|nr:hypothetical protein C8F01DRAFT_1085345 [Mycena amicta]
MTPPAPESENAASLPDRGMLFNISLALNLVNDSKGFSLPTIEASSDEEDASRRVIRVPDDSPVRPARRPRPRFLQSESLFKLRHIVGHPLGCVSISAPSFIRIECPDDMLCRFAGIADLAAEQILEVHGVATVREQRRRMMAGIAVSSTSRDAPVPPGTFATSLLPVPQVAAAMLEKFLPYVDGRLGVSGVRAYAVRVRAEDLYIGPVREPPDLTAILHRIPKEYICGVCLSAKSHPVIIGMEFDSQTRRTPSLGSFAESDRVTGVGRAAFVQYLRGRNIEFHAALGISAKLQSSQMRENEQVPFWLPGKARNATMIAYVICFSLGPSTTTWSLLGTVTPKRSSWLGIVLAVANTTTANIRRERIRSKRCIAKTHISRIRLPDLVEDWACADLRTSYEIFTAAHTAADDFDESEFSHWLHYLPFDLAAIAIAEDPSEYDEYSNWYVSCAVDGCLLRREQQREAQHKEELGRIGKKKTVDHLCEEVKSLLARDWAEMQALSSLYKPGTREHTIIKSLLSSASMPIRRPGFITRFFSAPPSRDEQLRLQHLRDDPELPYGKISSLVDALNQKHWQITLAGRIVSVVDDANERYLVLEALPGNHMLEDFKELVWALGRVQERTSVVSTLPSHNSYPHGQAECQGCQRLGTSGNQRVGQRLHICSPHEYNAHGEFQLTLAYASDSPQKTHAWERDESWVTVPTLIQPALSDTRIIDPIETGAAVFCVANLLRIDNILNETPPVMSSHWVIKARFVARLHLPTPGAEGQNPEMAVFLSRGSGPVGIRASEELPVRDDTGDA